MNGKRLARTDIDPEVEEGEGKIIFHEVYKEPICTNFRGFFAGKVVKKWGFIHFRRGGRGN